MEEIEIGGTVMLPVGANLLRVDYVNWQGRAWLAPIWLEEANGNTRRPLRLIAPRFAPGVSPPPGPDVLNIFQQMPLIQPTLDQGFVPAEMAPLLHIVENPNVFVRNGRGA